MIIPSNLGVPSRNNMTGLKQSTSGSKKVIKIDKNAAEEIKKKREMEMK